MDFALSEEQGMLRKTAQQFAKRVLAPIEAQEDVMEHEDKVREVAKGLAELGFLTLTLDERYGGGGASYTDYIVVGEELSRGSSVGTEPMGANISVGEFIQRFASEELKEKYIPPLSTGKHIGTLAFTEPATGTDWRALTTMAQKEGDYYIINGFKRFASNATYAGPMLVFAKEGETLSVFLVEKPAEGMTIESIHDLMMRGIVTTDVSLTDVKVPVANRIGESGMAMSMLSEYVGIGSLGIAAETLGSCQRALDLSVKYTMERTQRGRPIASFQMIQHLIADMATMLEAMRWLTYRDAWLADKGGLTASDVAKLRLFTRQGASSIMDKAMEVHGCYSITKDLIIERLWRRAGAMRLLEGTNGIQRVIVAASLLR